MGETWVQVTVVVSFVLALAALFIVAWFKVRPVVVKEQGYPYEKEIESLLIPLADRAIQAAFKVSEWAADDLLKRLDGIDKKWIADSTYELFPDEVGGFDVQFVKSFVSQQRWQEIVQAQYDSFRAWYIHNLEHFKEAFEEVKEDRTG